MDASRPFQAQEMIQLVQLYFHMEHFLLSYLMQIHICKRRVKWIFISTLYLAIEMSRCLYLQPWNISTKILIAKHSQENCLEILIPKWTLTHHWCRSWIEGHVCTNYHHYQNLVSITLVSYMNFVSSLRSIRIQILE